MIKKMIGIIAIVIVMAFHSHAPAKRVVIGYVAGYKGIVDTAMIDATQLTHINYAFVDVRDSLAWLHNEITDTINFRNLVALKNTNPDLKILISIGGWSWSKNFSDAVLTASSRRSFAQSAVNIIRQYELDGVDIDWEYPNMRGDNNVYRPEDRANYTLLFEELRNEMNELAKTSHNKYLLTTAVGGFAEFIQNTEMKKAASYLDYVNLMTYDYSWGVAGHHSNLYPSVDYKTENSTDKAVAEFLKAGVPKRKIVIGLAFYGKGGIVADSTNNGLHSKLTSIKSGGGYSFIRDNLVGKKGFVSYWDEKARAPYLFNATTKQFISYDDERSVREKCNYVKEKKLAGVMFWEYSSDPKGYLLRTVNESFRQ